MGAKGGKCKSPIKYEKVHNCGHFIRKREGKKTFWRLGRKLESNINLISGNTFPVPGLDYKDSR